GRLPRRADGGPRAADPVRVRHRPHRRPRRPVCRDRPARGAVRGMSEAPQLQLDVVTIFPDYLAPLRQSLLGRAIERGQVGLGIHDLRRWTDDVHRTVDDTPYGGGPGMVMLPEPWGRALDELAPPGGRQP